MLSRQETQARSSVFPHFAGEETEAQPLNGDAGAGTQGVGPPNYGSPNPLLITAVSQVRRSRHSKPYRLAQSEQTPRSVSRGSRGDKGREPLASPPRTGPGAWEERYKAVQSGRQWDLETKWRWQLDGSAASLPPAEGVLLQTFLQVDFPLDKTEYFFRQSQDATVLSTQTNSRPGGPAATLRALTNTNL